jgi:4a-hydroxytetrahydrobiopterin dehydratase
MNTHVSIDTVGCRLIMLESSMSTELAEKTCTPCRGGIPALTSEEAQRYLAQAQNWALLDDGRKIERTYRFKDFREALGFVAQAGALAEAEGHHPDIAFGWGYATISLQTKKIKGLHENDFIMAVKLDRIATA